MGGKGPIQARRMSSVLVKSSLHVLKSAYAVHHVPGVLVFRSVRWGTQTCTLGVWVVGCISQQLFLQNERDESRHLPYRCCDAASGTVTNQLIVGRQSLPTPNSAENVTAFAIGLHMGEDALGGGVLTIQSSRCAH